MVKKAVKFWGSMGFAAMQRAALALRALGFTSARVQ